MGKIVGLIIEEKKFVCPHCNKEYKTADSLEKHINDKHSEPDGGQQTQQ